MAMDKRIKEESQRLQSLQTLIQTYEEIAASRMQKVKASVLNNREFLSKIFGIYQQVKFFYDKEIKALQKRSKKSGDFGILKRNGKTVSVLLSANTGLYGDLIWKTFKVFTDGIEGKETDIVVVGKVGRTLVESAKGSLGIDSYTYFDLPDNASSSEDFTEIVSHIVSYEKVVVYHGQFESILTQEPVAEVLSGDLPEDQVAETEDALYLFEPDLEKIVGFFESEIMAAIFEQSLHESSLSKYAARMINLDRAVVNISSEIKATEIAARRAHHRVENKKQVSLLSSRALWG